MKAVRCKIVLKHFGNILDQASIDTKLKKQILQHLRYLRYVRVKKVENFLENFIVRYKLYVEIYNSVPKIWIRKNYRGDRRREIFLKFLL
jgi:hypothetical protein